MVETKHGSPVVDKASLLLDAVAKARSGSSLAELVDLLGVPRSTVYRILNSLTAHGLVARIGEGKKYGLGPKFVELARTLSPGADRAVLIEAARPIMVAAAERLRESLKLAMPDGDDMLTILAAPSPAEYSLFIKIGGRSPKHVGAAGKLSLAYSDVAEINSYCERGLIARTPYTITDPEMLREALADIRRNGFAQDNQESTLGLVGLSAPIFDKEQRFVGAISVPLIGALTPERTRAVRRELLSSSRALTSAIGGQHPLSISEPQNSLLSV